MSESPNVARRSRPSRPESSRSRGASQFFVSAAFHALAVIAMAAGSAAFFTTGATWSALTWTWRDGTFLDAVAPGLAAHLGLCALVWAMIALSFSRLKNLFAPADAGRPRVLTLGAKNAGSVLTETIIILPVALVLIMGIAQLTLINITATLSDLAVIQAARSAWVWMPEAVEGRFNVDRSLVIQKARVQAAAVLAPVASSDFGSFAKGSHSGYAETFQKTMGAIYGAQLRGGGGNDVGSYARAKAELQLQPGREIVGEQLNFTMAFDASTFKERSARKFYNSWAHTEIQLAETANRIGVEMTFHYLCLMPLVAGVFGEYKEVNGENGYFLTIERKYTLRKQVKVNASLPLR
jgi:hypothetical protein